MIFKNEDVLRIASEEINEFFDSLDKAGENNDDNVVNAINIFKKNVEILEQMLETRKESLTKNRLH